MESDSFSVILAFNITRKNLNGGHTMLFNSCTKYYVRRCFVILVFAKHLFTEYEIKILHCIVWNGAFYMVYHQILYFVEILKFFIHVCFIEKFEETSLFYKNHFDQSPNCGFNGKQ